MGIMLDWLKSPKVLDLEDKNAELQYQVEDLQKQVKNLKDAFKATRTALRTRARAAEFVLDFTDVISLERAVQKDTSYTVIGYKFGDKLEFSEMFCSTTTHNAICKKYKQYLEECGK
jgi:hypothetical protein